MAGYPTEVSGTPVNITIVIVKHVLVGHGGIDHVATGGVQNAFWRTGRARGVQHEQRVFRIHWLWLAFGRGVLHQVFVTQVAPFGPGHLIVTGARHHDHLVDLGVVLMLEGGIHVLLQRDGTATTQTFICGNYKTRFAVHNPCGQSFRREATKHHRVDRTNTCAGQHGNGSFNNHGHVDGNHITLLDALILEHVGKLAGLFVELPVGDIPGYRGIVPLKDDRGLIAPLFQVTVQAVGRGVQDTVLEPFDG